MTALRVTAVFGGGGAKAAAQIGALRALEEAGLRPTRYVGTSMGGVIAAGAASGASADELSRRFRSVQVTEVARPRALTPVAGLWFPSLLRPEPLRETIARLKSIPRERVENVLEMFSTVAGDNVTQVGDTDAYVRSVLKKLKRAQRKLGVISGSKLARRKKAAGASA